jgi:hypothetical protein
MGAEMLRELCDLVPLCISGGTGFELRALGLLGRHLAT